MFEGPTLETGRLLLRVPQASDFDAFALMNTDEDNMRFIGGTLGRAAAWRKFLQMPGAWLLQGFAVFSIIEKFSGRRLGPVGAWA
ncbi:MAG: GNAT family N-acetyltransferase, partial [Frankiaceae bacterium]|nr:GNAT family N-acetyltransferase [Arenimonas sp.]